MLDDRDLVRRVLPPRLRVGECQGSEHGVTSRNRNDEYGVRTETTVTYRELIRILERDGWFLERTVGSHMQYRHPQKPGTVTVPGGGKLGRDVPPGTLNSVRKQAQLK